MDRLIKMDAAKGTIMRQKIKVRIDYKDGSHTLIWVDSLREIDLDDTICKLEVLQWPSL